MFEVVITSDVPCLLEPWNDHRKVMNNNCVQASMNGQEVIISGPGVGYNKKYGMSVPEHPANRIFYVRNEQKTNSIN